MYHRIDPNNIPKSRVQEELGLMETCHGINRIGSGVGANQLLQSGMIVQNDVTPNLLLTPFGQLRSVGSWA
ncbi:MAG: hypothetical protein UHY58_01295 [Alistipes sp.]|nr:hypothetical protein [Alistipes sp.]